MVLLLPAVQMRYNVNISMLKARGIGDLGIFHDERDEMHAKRQKCAMEEPGMHPKNIYRYETPNFRQLVDIFPELKQYTIKANDGHAGLDFRNWDACRELVKVQFTHDFGIIWTIPRPHLIPPLANRLNYLCFIHDLICLWSPDPKNRPSYEYNILDIGCGANLVYPLLGTSYFGWSFVGCDIQMDALLIAARNRDSNPSVSPRIILKKVARQPSQGDGQSATSGILGSCLQDGDMFDACVCNPPFFSNENDMGQNPSTDYGGTHTEMVYQGGEECFVSEMVRDSEKHRASVAWFSTMVGKKKTLKNVKKLLYSLDDTVIRTNELVQGTTHRWVIAWSFIAPRHIQDMPLPRYSKC